MVFLFVPLNTVLSKDFLNWIWLNHCYCICILVLTGYWYWRSKYWWYKNQEYQIIERKNLLNYRTRKKRKPSTNHCRQERRCQLKWEEDQMLLADLLVPLYHSMRLPQCQTELSLSSCCYLSSPPLSARLGWYLQDTRMLYTCISLTGSLIQIN